MEKTKQTSQFLNKYELARVLAVRASQISMNAPVSIDTEGLTDPLEIAKMELKSGELPMIVRRILPSGDHEDWSLKELIFINC